MAPRNICNDRPSTSGPLTGGIKWDDLWEDDNPSLPPVPDMFQDLDGHDNY